MTEKEKLIKLLNEAPKANIMIKDDPVVVSSSGSYTGKTYRTAEIIADHLLANGVTFKEDISKLDQAEKALKSYKYTKKSCDMRKSIHLQPGKESEKEVKFIEKCLSKLPKQDANILKAFYVDRLSPGQIMDKFSYEHSQIYRIRHRALKAFADLYAVKDCEPMTNFDKIKSMTLNEFAEFLSENICEIVFGTYKTDSILSDEYEKQIQHQYKDTLVQWLVMEAGGENGNM